MTRLAVRVTPHIMDGASRASSSQPLLIPAPKTASGGKNAARRFASGRITRNPAECLGKIPHRSQTRVGAPILGNTIGNLVAEGIAGDGKPKSSSKETAKSGSSITSSDGTPSSGSGADSADAEFGDIVVTARRRDFRLASYNPNGEWGQNWNPFAEAGQAIFDRLEQNRRDLIQRIDNLPRDAASEALTKIAKTSAQISIDAALSLDSTSSLSKLILGDFENGTGPVRRVFGPGSDGVRELFSGPTGEYFRSESSHAISYLANKYGVYIPN